MDDSKLIELSCSNQKLPDAKNGLHLRFISEATDEKMMGWMDEFFDRHCVDPKLTN